MKAIHLATATAIILVSCGVNTSIVSIAEESFKGAEYTKIAVSAPYDDLETRSYIEGVFKSVLSSENVKVYRAMDLFPPLNPYTYSDFREKMEENGVECVLVVSIADFWNTYYTTPGQSITETESDIDVTYNSWGGLFGIYTSHTQTAKGKSRSTTSYIPGATFSQTNVKLDVRLFLLEAEKTPRAIWRANSTSSGDYFISGSTVLEEAAYKVGINLERDGFIKKEKVSPKEKKEVIEFRN